jgi:transposase-like protein
MATLEQVKAKQPLRINRYFSEEFKKKKVNELDKKITTISEICREYELSATAVYKWIYKYSLMKKKGVKIVVEAESDTTKIKALKQHILQLEQLLGQKQFELDFLQKQMELASKQYGIDLKKKVSGKPLFGFGSTEGNIPTK